MRAQRDQRTQQELAAFGDRTHFGPGEGVGGGQTLPLVKEELGKERLGGKMGSSKPPVARGWWDF